MHVSSFLFWCWKLDECICVSHERNASPRYWVGSVVWTSVAEGCRVPDLYYTNFIARAFAFLLALDLGRWRSVFAGKGTGWIWSFSNPSALIILRLGSLRASRESQTFTSSCQYPQSTSALSPKKFYIRSPFCVPYKNASPSTASPNDLISRIIQ